MKKTLGMALCVSLLTLMSGCGLDTLAGLAGIDISGVDINGLLNQVQTLAAQYSSGNQAQNQHQNWSQMQSKYSPSEPQCPW